MISKNKPFFIVGCGRSGTTLLRMLLTVHGEIVIPPEANFLVKSVEELHDDMKVSNEKIDEFVSFIESITNVKSLEFPKNYLNNYLKKRKPSNLAECIELVYIAYAERYGKTRWGHKNPFYVLKLDVVNRIFPDCKIIHMIRDGRDVAISYRKAPSGSSNVFLMAKRWTRCVMKGQEWGKRFPNRYLEVYYEKLIEEPEKILREVCDFIGVEFVPEMLESYKQNKDLNLIPKGRQDHHGNLSKPIMSSNKEKWRKQMSKKDIIIFELLSGSTLELLGYKTNLFTIPLKLWCYHLFCQLRYTIGQNNCLRAFSEKVPWRVKQFIHNTFLIDSKHYR